jgi:ABC-2 type transport system ATP-binding protein
MKVAEQLVYLGRVHGLDSATARRRTAELLDLMGLADRSGDLLQTLSLGNQQRVQLAAALVHEPDLLVLDEPFAGLDPVGVDAMSEVLAERAEEGATVLFSSHQLDLVEHLCKTVVIIHRGRLVAEGDVEELRRGGRPRLAVRVAGDPEGHWAQRLAAWLADVVQVQAGTVLLALVPGADAQAVLEAARAAGPVEHFAYERRRLSEVFREAVGARLEDVDAEARARAESVTAQKGRAR